MNEKDFNWMADELVKISYRDEMRKILREVLSVKERRDLSKRMKIREMRGRGLKMREIAKILGVSKSTVNRWGKK